MTGRRVPAVQTSHDYHESRERVGYLNQRLTVDGNRRGNDNGRSTALVEVAGMFFVFDEGDVTRPSFVKRGRP